MVLKVKQKKQETKDVFSIIFEKPENFHFYPGQYLDYELEVVDPDGNTRAFTISASPTEDFLLLSTRHGQTPFKKALAKLKPGESITTSHPAGTFILDESTPAIFIAGGIGITPFRSMIKYAIDNNLKTPITLIYSNSDKDFPFKNELDIWQKVYTKLEIIYHNSSKTGHLTTLSPKPYPLNPIYYLAGSHSFVNNMEKILKDLSVDETNIRYDRFDGYS